MIKPAPINILKVGDRVCIRIRLNPTPRSYRDKYLHWHYEHAVAFDGQFATIQEVKHRPGYDGAIPYGRKNIDIIKYLVDFDKPIKVEHERIPCTSFHFDYREVIRLD